VLSALPSGSSVLYMDHYLSPDTKAQAVSMLEEIRSAFNKTLGEEQWLDPATVEVARLKLSKAELAVGGPSNVNTPSEQFEVNEHYAENYLRSNRAKVKHALAQLKVDINRKSWHGDTATDVNSFYSRDVNVLFIPAGILQPPFFDPSRVHALNFGSSGAIFGHEFTHGFDDVGRKFDQNCRRKDWWPGSVVQEYEDRAECISELYSSYTFYGKHVSGNLTLAEDIADMGGLRLSWRALSTRLGGTINTETARLFFAAWGQTWCSVERKAEARMVLRTDQHSPDRVSALVC